MRLTRLLRRSSTPVARQYRAVINWGNSSDNLEMFPSTTLVNCPQAVALAVDKLRALNVWSQIDGLHIPEYWTTKPDKVESGIIFARTKINSSGGDGIVVCRPGDAIPDAPLYTRYIPKREEYRVHVVNDKVIFIQQKKRMLDVELSRDDKLIRNHANGWVFCLVDMDTIPEEIKHAGRLAVNGLGLHFGAVDILVGRDDNLPYVLECNTAPGLSSPTLLAAYKEAFESWLLK